MGNMNPNKDELQNVFAVMATEENRKGGKLFGKMRYALAGLIVIITIVLVAFAAHFIQEYSREKSEAPPKIHAELQKNILPNAGKSDYDKENFAESIEFESIAFGTEKEKVVDLKKLTEKNSIFWGMDGDIQTKKYAAMKMPSMRLQTRYEFDENERFVSGVYIVRKTLQNGEEEYFQAFEEVRNYLNEKGELIYNSTDKAEDVSVKQVQIWGDPKVATITLETFIEGDNIGVYGYGDCFIIKVSSPADTPEPLA